MAGSSRFWPYKIGIALLYGKLEGIRRIGPGEIIANNGKMADHFNIKHDRLQECYVHLLELGVIEHLSKEHGYYIIKLADPVGWEKKLGAHAQ